MPYVTIETTHGLTQEQWEAGLYAEYLGEFPLYDLMGTGAGSVIQVKDDLTKKPGDAISIGIRAKLLGTGVSGATRLKGQEEDLKFYSQRITIDEFRHGVLLRGKMSQQRVAFNLRNESKDALKDWLKEKTENDIVDALKDTSVGRTRARYLYGAADSNWNTTHATALANVDTTADKLTLAMIEKAKRKALLEGQAKVRPFEIKMGKGMKIAHKYVLLAHPYAVRDLKTDTNWKTLQQNLIQAGQVDVPLITGSMYVGEWDGVLIYSYERVPILSGAGASSADLAHNFLLGAQACAMAWGERTTWAEDLDDYDNEHGFKIGEVRGVKKLFFNRTSEEDHGLVNVFSTAAAD